jgi:hypothetical protein
MPGISDLGGRNGAPKVQVRRKSMPENMELYSEFEDGRNIIGDEPDGIGIGALHQFMDMGQVSQLMASLVKRANAERDVDGASDSTDGPEAIGPEIENVPAWFSSAPGKRADLTYTTQEERELLRSMGLGHSAEGSGEPVAPGERQHMGPKGIPSYNGEGGYGGPGQASATDRR